MAWYQGQKSLNQPNNSVSDIAMETGTGENLIDNR